MKRQLAVLVVSTSLLMLGCPRQKADPPPPPGTYEIAPAPPQALGALAGGTEAAPGIDELLAPHGYPPLGGVDAGPPLGTGGGPAAADGGVTL